jgi:hypothetical protein
MVRPNLGSVLVASLLACASSKPEPYVKPVGSSASSPSSSVMLPDGPPPKIPTNDEIRDAGRPEHQKAERKIPDEPPDDPTPPDDKPKPAAHKKVDALLVAIEKADALDIVDQWEGMTGSHRLHLRLDRKGEEVAYRADVTGMMGTTKKKTGTTPFANVRPFLHRLSRKRVDRKQDYRVGPTHTDDYPHIEVVVTGKSLGAPLKLLVEDNQRHWRANGLFIAPDPPPEPVEATVITIGPVGSGESRTEKQMIQSDDKHERINVSFNRMLGLIGAYEWLDEVSKSR